MSHSTKTIALPAGWEAFVVTERGHPGAPWVTAGEFAKARGISTRSARPYLAERAQAGQLKTCSRVIGCSTVTLYAPVEPVKRKARA